MVKVDVEHFSYYKLVQGFKFMKSVIKIAMDVSSAISSNTHCYFNNKSRCPWCNGYHRRKWTQRHEFKSWTRLIAFHIVLIPLGKV